MENTIKVSIITVCYNSENTIKRTIESVLNQSYNNYEYIIIDGASKDKTLNIINSFRYAFGDKLKVFSEPDAGIYDAMNKGIKKASGELIGILNSDDYYEPNALLTMATKYKELSIKYNHILLYGMQRLILDGKELGIEFYNHNFIGKVMINHPTCFLSKKTYDDFGAFDISYKSAADLDFLLKLKKNTDTFFYPVYAIITNFQVGGMSSSKTGVNEALKIRYKYGLISKSRMIYESFQNTIKSICKSIKE